VAVWRSPAPDENSCYQGLRAPHTSYFNWQFARTHHDPIGFSRFLLNRYLPKKLTAYHAFWFASSVEARSPQGLVEGNKDVFVGTNFERELEVPLRIILNIKLTIAVRMGVREFLATAQEMDM